MYSPFYYDNVVVPGGLYAYWAKLLPQIAASTASLKSFCPEAGFTASGFAKMFGCTGAALAFYNTAKPEKEKESFRIIASYHTDSDCLRCNRANRVHIPVRSAGTVCSTCITGSNSGNDHVVGGNRRYQLRRID